MITSADQAIAVQARRLASGRKGRSKAVRRWFKRTYGRAVEAHTNPTGPIARAHKDIFGKIVLCYVDLRYELKADFTGCRRFDEVHHG